VLFFLFGFFSSLSFPLWRYRVRSFIRQLRGFDFSFFIYVRNLVTDKISFACRADIDVPIQLQAASGGGGGGGGKAEPNPEQVAMLADMGFTHAQARKALRETVRPFDSLLRTID
jgi:hypothetical protein